MNNYRNSLNDTPAYIPVGSYSNRGRQEAAGSNPFDPKEERPKAPCMRATERSDEQPQLPCEPVTAQAALNGPLAFGESNDSLAWNDVIRDTSTPYLLLNEGNYTFTVAAVEQGRFPGSAKNRPCGKALVTLCVDTPDGPAYARRDFFLREKYAWQLADFFRCIGMLGRGEEMRMDWDAAIGRTGHAHFRPEQYTNAYGDTRDKNTVTAFYDPDDRVHFGEC